MPYLFISCSDDETVKIWGVNSKVKIELVSLPKGKDGVKHIDIKNEEENKGEESEKKSRRSRHDQSRNSSSYSDSSSSEKDQSSSGSGESDNS